MSQSYRLRRSLLFVPGDEPRKLEKARGSGADTLLFDLEDSVVPERKAEARCQVARLLGEGGFEPTETAVRVNAVGTPHFDDDLASVVGAGARTILLPKAESAQVLDLVARQLDALERRLEIAEGDRVRLLALVESAAGVAVAHAVASATPRIDALCFGHADFALDMRLDRADASSGVVFHARCAIAIAARAAGVAPIDNVCLAVRDDAAFREDAALGLSLGFEGKLCIHPSQVPIANEVHTPTAEQVEHALRVVDGWQKAQAEGRGVFALAGMMVDAPVASAQARVLERARRAGLLPEGR